MQGMGWHVECTYLGGIAGGAGADEAAVQSCGAAGVHGLSSAALATGLALPGGNDRHIWHS